MKYFAFFGFQNSPPPYCTATDALCRKNDCVPVRNEILKSRGELVMAAAICCQILIHTPL